jgi:hypothetical protein
MGPLANCVALVFSALLLPTSHAEGPSTPSEVEGAWVEQGGGAAGSGQAPLFRKEGTDFSSGSRASHPTRTSCSLGLPGRTLSTLFGD